MTESVAWWHGFAEGGVWLMCFAMLRYYYFRRQDRAAAPPADRTELRAVACYGRHMREISDPTILREIQRRLDTYRREPARDAQGEIAWERCEVDGEVAWRVRLLECGHSQTHCEPDHPPLASPGIPLSFVCETCYRVRGEA